MSEDARTQAAGAVGDGVVERASQERGPVVDRAVGESEEDCYDPKREPGELSDRDSGEIVVDKVAKEKSSPEDFLEQGNYDDKADESHSYVRNKCGVSAKESGVETVPASGHPEHLLWRDPEHKHENANADRE